MNTNSPFSTVKLMLCRASVPLLYTLDTLRNSIKPMTCLSLKGLKKQGSLAGPFPITA